MKKTSRDMTNGSITIEIIIFALPILCGQIFQNLYNSVDSIVVGNFVGTTALAAVTSSADISRLLVGFFTGLSTGSGVLFSRYFGAREYRTLHEAIHTALLFAIILGIIMASIGITASPFLLKVVDCPEDVYNEALLYLRVYFVGVLFTSMYNVASGVLRAMGDSKRPFIYLVIASVTNIILDVVFVMICGMGVEGVAIATIISQFISVFLVLRNMIFTEDVYRLVIKDLKINTKMLGEVLSLGLPAALQTCMTSVSNLFVQRYINGFGSSAMAGVGAAKKIDKYVGMIAQSIGLTITTFISQNVGAKKHERTFQGIRVVMLLGFITVAALGIPIYYFSEVFLRIFTSDAEAIRYGSMMVKVLMPLYYLQTLHQLFGNAVRGFGKSTIVMMTTVFGLIGCRQLFLGISMGINHTITNVFWAYPVGWACSAVFAIVYYIFAVRIPYTKRIKSELAE